MKHCDPSLIERNLQIVEMSLSGKTGLAIAKDLGLSRVRIFQILTEYGCKGKEKSELRIALRRVAERQTRDKLCLDKYGFSCEEMRALRNQRRAFNMAKKNARQRGILWNFNFRDWWTIWEPHWEKRGKYEGEFVMSRFNDEGPYEVGNVNIVSSSDNIREYQARRWARAL